MRPPHDVTRRSLLLCLGALAAACGRLPTGPDVGTLPCFICLVTTDLRIDGVAPVAVGDTLRLRAVAYQQNVAFQGRFIPSKAALWTVTFVDSGRASLTVIPATADTATWGHALLVARAPGAIAIQAQEGTIATTRTITILPAAPANEALQLTRR